MEVARRWYKSGICLLWSVKQGRLRELMVKCVLWLCVPLLCLGVCLYIVICLWCRVGGCLSYVCVMGVFVCMRMCMFWYCDDHGCRTVERWRKSRESKGRGSWQRLLCVE